MGSEFLSLIKESSEASPRQKLPNLKRINFNFVPRRLQEETTNHLSPAFGNCVANNNNCADAWHNFHGRSSRSSHRTVLCRRSRIRRTRKFVCTKSNELSSRGSQRAKLSSEWSSRRRTDEDEDEDEPLRLLLQSLNKYSNHVTS